MSQEFYLNLKLILNKKFNLLKVLNLPNLQEKDIVEVIESIPEFCIVNSREGKSSRVENKNDTKDWGKNNDFFPFHLDGGYYSKIPKYAILYCAGPSEKGGETFFTESSYVINKLVQKYDNNFLDSLNIVYMSPDKKKYKKPLIEKVELGSQLNWYSSLYIEPDINKLPDDRRRLFTKFINELIMDIENLLREGICLKHSWSEGDLVLFNNQLLLHGREKILDNNSNRLLYRIWFDEGNFDETKKPIL